MQSWKDRLNNISGLLDGKELTSQILSNVAHDIEKITATVESSDYMTDAIDIDVNSFSETKDILATGDDKSWLGERNNTTTSTDTTTPRSHAHIFKMPKITLDYYRNLSHFTYLLIYMSTNTLGGAICIWLYHQ